MTWVAAPLTVHSIDKQREGIMRNPNAVPYLAASESERAGFLVRQYTYRYGMVYLTRYSRTN